MSSVLSVGEMLYVQQGTDEHDIRVDGRSRSLERGCNVEVLEPGVGLSSCGSTRVIAIISLDLAAPNADEPARGAVHCSVEMSEACRRASRDAQAVCMGAAHALQTLLEVNVLDIQQLVVIHGRHVWNVYVDVIIEHDDGAILDCASLAALAALSTVEKPELTVITPDVDDVDARRALADFDVGGGTGFFKVQRFPVFISLTRFGRGFIVDASSIEEASMDAQLIVGVDEEGMLVSVHTRGPHSLPGVGTLEGIRIAQTYAKTRIAVLKAALSATDGISAKERVIFSRDALSRLSLMGDGDMDET